MNNKKLLSLIGQAEVNRQKVDFRQLIQGSLGRGFGRQVQGTGGTCLHFLARKAISARNSERRGEKKKKAGRKRRQSKKHELKETLDESEREENKRERDSDESRCKNKGQKNQQKKQRKKRFSSEKVNLVTSAL